MSYTFLLTERIKLVIPHPREAYLLDCCIDHFTFQIWFYYINIFSKCKLPLYELDGFIFTVSQVGGLCKLITQHRRTLTSLEFIHCTVYIEFINAILDSVVSKGVEKHGIKHLSIVSSSFGQCTVALPSGLESFVSSAR